MERVTPIIAPDDMYSLYEVLDIDSADAPASGLPPCPAPTTMASHKERGSVGTRP
jgi:ribosomal protein S27AE